MSMTLGQKMKAVILAAVAAMMAVPPAAALAHEWGEDEPTTIYTELAAEDLEALARLFSEAPVAVTFNAALVGIPCGQEGHCNYIECDIDCEPNQDKQCTCSPTGKSCDDRHTWYDPFDNDKHTMYECKCGCYNQPQDPPPPPKCLVKVGDTCIISGEGNINIRPGSEIEPKPL